MRGQRTVVSDYLIMEWFFVNTPIPPRDFGLLELAVPIDGLLYSPGKTEVSRCCPRQLEPRRPCAQPDNVGVVVHALHGNNAANDRVHGISGSSYQGHERLQRTRSYLFVFCACVCVFRRTIGKTIKGTKKERMLVPGTNEWFSEDNV